MLESDEVGPSNKTDRHGGDWGGTGLFYRTLRSFLGFALTLALALHCPVIMKNKRNQEKKCQQPTYCVSSIPLLTVFK